MRMMKLTADHYAELQGMMDTVVDGMGPQPHQGVPLQHGQHL